MQEMNVNVEQKNGVIGFNFDEIKQKLAAEMEIYKGMVFTEDSKKEAKATVAELRKLKKSVDDKKKEVKVSYMQPYTEFENKVKELNQLIDEPINFISEQVEEFERKRLEEKKKVIDAIYTENIDGMEEYIPLSKIYDKKWENATTSKKAITDDISAHVLNVKKDLDTIRAIGSDYEDKGIDAYKRTLSLADAIQCINNYEKQAIEIRKRQEEEARREAERAAKVEQNHDERCDLEIPKEINETKPVDAFVEPKPVNERAIYEIEADPFQIVQLESNMRGLGIKFRRIKA